MIVCHCMRVNDRLIRSLVREGAAATTEEIGEVCGAGACCGGCRPAIDQIVREECQTKDVVLLPLRDRTVSARSA